MLEAPAKASMAASVPEWVAVSVFASAWLLLPQTVLSRCELPTCSWISKNPWPVPWQWWLGRRDWRGIRLFAVPLLEWPEELVGPCGQRRTGQLRLDG